MHVRLVVVAIIALIGGVVYAIQPHAEVAQVKLVEWAYFLGYSMLLELAAAVANDLLFVGLDVSLGNRAWQLVYQLRCADGPFGFFVWVLVSQSVIPP